MKGGYLIGAPPLKRRWKGQAITVVALVFFSIVVPLAFLLGIHNTFPSVYFNDNDERSDSERSFAIFNREDGAQELSEVDNDSRVESFVKKSNPGLSQDLDENTTGQEDPQPLLETDNESSDIDIQANMQQNTTISEAQDLDENTTSQEDSSLHLKTENIDVQGSQQKATVSDLQDAAAQSKGSPMVQRQVTVPEKLPDPNTRVDGPSQLEDLPYG